MSDNEIISKFMGVTTDNPDYNCWNSLMPVINEIEYIAEVTIMGTTCHIWTANQNEEAIYIDEGAMNKFEATKRAIVDYIQWYNNNNNNNNKT